MGSRYLPVACFGKLRFWPEYMEHGTSLPTAKALKQWLHLGREHAGLEDDDGGKSDIELRSHLRMLIGLPGSTELLVGVLRPSSDQGGRHFPFAVFSFIPRKSFGKHYALLPLALSPVWEMLDDAWSSLAAVASKSAFEESLQSLEVTQPALPGEVKGIYQGRQQEPLDPLFERGDGASFDRLGENLPGVLARLGKGRDGEGSLVEFPVSADLDAACFDASVWIDLINRQFLLRRFDPTVFLDATPGREDRRAVLKFGALTPEDYPGVMGLGSAGLLPSRPAHGPEGAVSAAAAGAGGLTYDDLLRKKLSAKG